MLSPLLLARMTSDPPDRFERRPPDSSCSVRRLHVHWFRRVGDDPFSGASLYSCRCGEVRPAF